MKIRIKLTKSSKITVNLKVFCSPGIGHEVIDDFLILFHEILISVAYMNLIIVECIKEDVRCISLLYIFSLLNISYTRKSTQP